MYCWRYGKAVLDNKGQSILGTTDGYGTAAIHYDPSVLSLIIDGINNNREVLNLSDRRGNTVLHHCVLSGHVETVEHVIKVPE